MKNQFESVFLTEEQQKRSQFVKSMASKFYDALTENSIESRELSIAKTKLEECVMWHTLSVAKEIKEGDRK